MRVVLGEDEVLLRGGIARLLTDAGFEVTAQAGDADAFLRKALAHRPDVAVVDVHTGVLVLSPFYEEHYALELVGARPEGIGDLLRGSALDPEIVGRMLGRRRGHEPLADLTERERDVLAAMAEGLSNQGIGEALFVAEAAVEKHVASISTSSASQPTPAGHRRVLAVLTYLRDAAE
jgi:DNA-binding NarL/FixJ family response regulator